MGLSVPRLEAHKRSHANALASGPGPMESDALVRQISCWERMHDWLYRPGAKQLRRRIEAEFVSFYKRWQLSESARHDRTGLDALDALQHCCPSGLYNFA